VLLRELLRLEVVLMENKNKEDLDKFFKENHANLDVLVNNLIVKPNPEAKVRKFNIKWKADDRQKVDFLKMEGKTET
jgi:short-subunit dehydrogenase involved in D-alanine esterification of teichoic acids